MRRAGLWIADWIRASVKSALYILGIALFFVISAGSISAVEPDEILDDPVLEQRARDISAGLRCLVCRNESIDESNADLARDLRLLVRERLVEGDSNTEVVDFVVARYGEYVLLNPTVRGANIVLWIAGPALLLIALGVALVYLRRRGRSAEPAAPLSAGEQARLRELLDE